MTSVVTIVVDRAAHLANLVRGLARCDPPPGELVVVDMGSAEHPGPVAVGAAAGAFAVRVVAVDGSGGLPLARARNAGAAAAEGGSLVFLDVDCIPAPDLVGAYRRAPAGVLACGPVRYLRRGWDDPPTGLDPARLEDRSRPHPLRPAPATDIADDRYELFWSLSFGLDRATWDRLGGFDERFRGYGAEDTDLACTARRLGVPLWWLARGAAFHQWHESAVPPVGHLADIVDNAVRFHAKWSTWPMRGWLDEFARRGLVVFEPGAGVLRRTGADPEGGGGRGGG